mgnify:CR=1 FL=1
MLKRLLYFIGLAIIQLLSSVTVQAADTSSLEEDIEEQPAKAIAYCYWIDDNVTAKTTKSFDGKEIQQAIDISSLKTGVHICHIRFQCKDSGWSPIQDISFYVSNVNDETKDDDGISPVAQYEYWINKSNKSTPIKYKQADIKIEVNTANLPDGKNSYQICSTDEKGRKSFFEGSFFTIDPTKGEDEVQEEPSKAVAYRYWLDENSSKKQEVSIKNAEEFTCNIDIANLAQGAHTLHLDLKSKDGRWLSGKDVCFYAGNSNQDAQEEATAIVKYEYWFDEQTKQTSSKFEKADIAIEKNLSEFSAGKHTFTISAIDKKGMRTFETGNFLCFAINIDDKEDATAKPVSYQYWIDSDKEHAKTVAYTKADISTALNVSNLTNGAHTFNLRIKNCDNIWGPTNQYVFYAPGKTDAADPSNAQQDIVGYRYGTNGVVKEKTLTAVSSITALSEEIEFPKLTNITNVEKYRFAFKEDKTVSIDRDLKMTYFIQFKNKLGEWGEPASCDSTQTESFTRTAKALELQRTLGIKKQDGGDFEIVNFTIPSANAYYLSTANNCNILLYQNNGLIQKLEAKDLVGNDKTSYFQKGNYYAVIYNQDEDGSIRITNSADCVPTPTLTYANHKVTATCAKQGAKIYYTLDGSMPTAKSTLYKSPIEMTYNGVVKAIALLDGTADSHIAKCEVNDFKTQTCATPTINYNGKKVTLSSSVANANIYYTTDGTTPIPGNSRKYSNESIEINGLGTIKAITTKDLMNNSEVATYVIPAYYDGKKQVEVKTAGNLAKAFEWNNGKPANENLKVIGTINTTDLSSLRGMTTIQHLDLSKVNIEGNALPDQSFANMGLKTISLPASLKTSGKELFTGNQALAAIIWNANENLPAEALSGIDNPNLLLYVNTKTYAPASMNNVVAGGNAESIVLTEPGSDIASAGNFYVPTPFTAQKISYTRNFKQETEIGVCQGWETIALPFEAQTITHETNGAIAPFAKGDKTAKPFWLYELSPNGGFQAAAGIKANTPYIISMPNSMSYSDEYILKGNVTFSATNAAINATAGNSIKNDYREFITTFEQIAKGDGIYALNVGEEYQGYRPGSIFADNYRDVKPFEAYLTTAQAAQAFSLQFGGGVTGIDNLPVKNVEGVKAWTNGSTLFIQSDKARKVMVFSTTGMLMKTVAVEAGETVSVSDLPSGIYIVNNKKVAIKR